jgi:hypothetical protein
MEGGNKTFSATGTASNESPTSIVVTGSSGRRGTGLWIGMVALSYGVGSLL